MCDVIREEEEKKSTQRNGTCQVFKKKTKKPQKREKRTRWEFEQNQRHNTTKDISLIMLEQHHGSGRRGSSCGWCSSSLSVPSCSSSSVSSSVSATRTRKGAPRMITFRKKTRQPISSARKKSTMTSWSSSFTSSARSSVNDRMNSWTSCSTSSSSSLFLSRPRATRDYDGRGCDESFSASRRDQIVVVSQLRNRKNKHHRTRAILPDSNTSAETANNSSSTSNGIEQVEGAQPLDEMYAIPGVRLSRATKRRRETPCEECLG